MNTNRAVALFTVMGGLAGCQSNAPTAPPVTSSMTASGSRQHADAAILATGRSLFVGRCARCHALPAAAEHSAGEWPALVGQMAKRSGLKADESRAVLSYILAARAE